MLKWRCVPEKSNMAAAPPDVTNTTGEMSSATLPAADSSSSTISPTADDSASARPTRLEDFQWGEEEHLDTFHDDSDKLPCVGRFLEDRSASGAKLPPGLAVYKEQPLLLFRRLRKRQARARTIYHDKSGAYFEIGQTILIPDDYTGWFELVPPDFSRSSCFRSIAEVANVMPRKFFTRSNLKAIRVDQGDDGEPKYLERKVPAGSFLKTDSVFAAKWRTQATVPSGLFKKKEAEWITQEIKYLKCIDKDEKEILIPLSHRGKFNAIYEKGKLNQHSVYTMKDILSDLKLPVRVPAVVCGKGEETFQLTSRRRREWLAQLKLKGLTFESTSRRFVCSDHFVSGVPAYLRDVNAPNWKPTLKLGHSDSVTPNSDRYERLRGRQSAGNDYSTSQFGESEEVLMQHDGGAEGFCNAGCMNTPPPQFGEDGGTYCQTDNTYANSSSLSAEEERMMRDELNRLTVENLELKEKLAQKEMTLESLKDSDDTVRYFTGLTNYLTLAALFRFVVNDIPRHKRRALSPFQALMLTLLHLRLDTPLQHLAYIFSVSRSTASKVFHETLNVLFYKLKPMVFWPSRESIRKTLPPQFQEYPWRKTVSIIDCFELFIERPSSPDASAQTWSNYKSNNTIKYLISITPQGLISFISKGWGGRVSDKQITGESGYLTNLLPGDLVLADRGFDIPELAAMVGAEVKIPAFTRGKCQMTAHEIESTRKLAHVRIHVERVIGLLCGKYTILNGDLPVELLFVREGEELTTLDKIVTVCCSLVNLCDGIIL